MTERAQTQLKPTAVPVLPTTGGTLQRKCACGTHTLGAQCDSCKGGAGLFQRKAAGRTKYSEVPPIVHEVLRSPGQPLDVATRAFFEPHFGHDFSQVRVHTDARAAESARAMNSFAYTVGQNIVFDTGHYAPGSASGRQLFAHELTHTIQQSSSASSLMNTLRVGAADDVLEKEADVASRDVSDIRRKPGISKVGWTLQRQAVGSEQMTAKTGSPWFESLIPAFEQEKQLTPPIHYPAIDLGAFIAKPTLSLVGSLTYGPANSLITISDGEFGVAMEGLAKSFSISFVKGANGSGVAFTSTLPGIGKHHAFTYRVEPPLTLIWSSEFTPPPLTFERLKVEGKIRLQLELLCEPKTPAYQYSPVSSPKRVPKPWPVILAALATLAKLGEVIGRTATAPIILLDPSLIDPEAFDRQRRDIES